MLSGASIGRLSAFLPLVPVIAANMLWLGVQKSERRPIDQWQHRGTGPAEGAISRATAGMTYPVRRRVTARGACDQRSSPRAKYPYAATTGFDKEDDVSRMLYYPLVTPPPDLLNQAVLYWDGLGSMAPEYHDFAPDLQLLQEAELYTAFRPETLPGKRIEDVGQEIANLLDAVPPELIEIPEGPLTGHSRLYRGSCHNGSRVSSSTEESSARTAASTGHQANFSRLSCRSWPGRSPSTNGIRASGTTGSATRMSLRHIWLRTERLEPQLPHRRGDLTLESSSCNPHRTLPSPTSSSSGRSTTPNAESSSLKSASSPAHSAETATPTYCTTCGRDRHRTKPVRVGGQVPRDQVGRRQRRRSHRRGDWDA
jgi:hypothetical protein